MFDALFFGYLFGGIKRLARGWWFVLHFIAWKESAEV